MSADPAGQSATAGTTAKRGDISVLIPIYQCAQRLPGHLRMLASLVGQVRELIWVVTPSPDGSHRLVRKASQDLGGIYLETPPGLYASWNEGIRQAACDYLYISTVGESISPEGLLEKSALLQNHAADLCFSPPEILPSTKTAIRRTRHWPVFRYRRHLARFAGGVVPVPVLAHLQILSGISCVIGSCASALFRTETLRRRPFPADFHHYGDTAWFYRNLFEIRTVFLNSTWSSFHVHDFSNRPILQSDLHRCVAALAVQLLHSKSGSRLSSQAQRLQRAREKLDHLREPHPFRYWWMLPQAWFWRLRRDWFGLKIWIGLLGYIFFSRTRGADR